MNYNVDKDLAAHSILSSALSNEDSLSTTTLSAFSGIICSETKNKRNESRQKTSNFGENEISTTKLVLNPTKLTKTEQRVLVNERGDLSTLSIDEMDDDVNDKNNSLTQTVIAKVNAMAERVERYHSGVLRDS